jgi:hypothetical protein
MEVDLRGMRNRWAGRLDGNQNELQPGMLVKSEEMNAA